ncbi:MAG: OmpA family protein [Bacteroidota bacterium]
MRYFFCLCIALLGSAWTLSAQDKAGSEDHPILTRYPGSSIKFYYQKSYNELQMATAVAKGDAAEFIQANGKHTSILYRGPDGRSSLEIFRNYQQAIEQAGGEILFACNGIYAPNGCDDYKATYGYKFFTSVYQKRRNATDQYLYIEGGDDDQAYLVGKFDRGNTITYVEIGITGKFLGHPTSIQLEVVEVSKMEGELITAESIKKQLDQYGKVQIYTIFFATNSAEIEQGSDATLQAIADFLAAHPSEKLYIVGHTDDTGSFGRNQQLSEQRAQAVVARLQGQMGELSDRLSPFGVGPLSPEGSNENEEGRSVNRRVELVRRLK